MRKRKMTNISEHITGEVGNMVRIDALDIDDSFRAVWWRAWRLVMGVARQELGNRCRK